MICVVDDDDSIREAIRTLLRSAGYEVAAYFSAEQFLDAGAIGETQCLILDMRMPGMNGLELLRYLNETTTGVPVIFVSAHDDPIRQQQALEAGAIDFLRKPFAASALIQSIQTALHGRAEAV